MKRIYTRTGDKGTTGIHGGTRVPKDDIRIEANGCLDELNCQIGIVRSQLRSCDGASEDGRCPVKPGMTIDCARAWGSGTVLSGTSAPAGPEKVLPRDGKDRPDCAQACPAGWDFILCDIQQNMMTVMSLVATTAAERKNNPNAMPEDLVTDCEATIDELSEQAGPALHFILPGGTPLAAQLQLARAVCRRAERRLWTLHHQDPVPEEILQYINRLSDLLFVMARCELTRQKWPEERWKAFTYKNQR